MDTLSKLQLLSDASRYDLSCACGTKSPEDHRTRGDNGTWLYPVVRPDGGTSIMLKTLMSNACVNDCKYCPFRATMDTPRCSLTPDETASLFMKYLYAKSLFGIFLTSGVIGSPDKTMAILNDTARILRNKHSYRGYIHIKVIPGASNDAIDDALSLASAVSINIETPGQHRLAHLSVKKNFQNDIIRPLTYIAGRTSNGGRFERVKQTTQFIVGASDETDSEIVKYTEGLYKKLKLHRVYYSAYQHGLGDREIPGERIVQESSDVSFMREHRLYQVDFLFRKYHFNLSDIYFNEHGSLSLKTDPKQVWADRHPEFYPVNINRADINVLLHVPGIGPVMAKRILKMREGNSIGDMDCLPVKGKRLETIKKYAVSS
jgi:predicted DNA-binding helix-hairpin-helix protein